MNFTSFHLIARSFVKNNFISFHFTFTKMKTDEIILHEFQFTNFFDEVNTQTLFHFTGGKEKKFPETQKVVKFS
jgi:hypothetical protein